MKKWLIPILFLLSLLMPRVSAAAELPFQDGDQIVIWAAGEGKALSATQSGSYSLAVSVTMADGALTGFTDTEVWTVTAGDGGWKFTNNGQYLSMGASYSTLQLDEIHDLWTVEAAGGDTFTFTNQGRSQLICLNSRRGQWNTCTAASAARSGTTELSIYVLPREAPPETEPPEPEPTEPVGPQIYFGQLHSHSDLSDGSQSPEALYAAAKAAGLDFFAVTDHSHSFDNAETATLADGSGSRDWTAGRAAADSATDAGFLALFGFEMTWNQGQGHMNTFFSPGFLSREREDFRLWAEGMENYYAALAESEGSVSQFNHPAGEYGNFKDFSAHSPGVDSRVTLIEVGKDLTPFFQALEEGWHLAPTLCGDAHSVSPDAPARTAVLANSLTEADFQTALASRRVYATTDSDLSIRFSLNGQEMGSILPRSQVGSRITLTAALSDPSDATIGTVEILGNGGEVLAECQLDAAQGEISFTLNANRDYYLLRITQSDGDWAVTAPIWLDDRDDLGIAALEPLTEVTTTGQAQTLRMTLYNDEDAELTITGLVLSIEGTEYALDPVTLPPCTGGTVEMTHTFPVDGVYTVTARMSGTLNGEPRQHSLSREVTVLPPVLVEDVALDAGHGCADTVTQLAEISAAREATVCRLTIPATARQLAECRLLIIPAPEEDFSADYVQAVTEFVQNGGSVVLCGTGASRNAAAAGRLNGLLAALGISGRFHADDARDENNNAGSPGLLRATDFAPGIWTADMIEGQYFLQNNGCSLDPGQGQWLVQGHSAEKPVLLCREETPYGGDIFLSGGNFLADDALLPPRPSEQLLPCANQTIWENILELVRLPRDIIPIAQLRTAEPGRIYQAEGRITAGTHNPHTTFPDAIYLQDHSGGIIASGYSDHGLSLGTRVRVLGELVTEGENPQLRILRLTRLEADVPVAPKAVTGLPDYDSLGGSLVALEGEAGDIAADGMAVSRFRLSGVTVIIEDAIHSGSRGLNELARIVREGNALRAVGLLHREAGQTVLRLRDCDEVWLLEGQSEEDFPTEPDGGTDDGEDPGDPDATNPTDPDGTDPSNPDATDPDETKPTNPDGSDATTPGAGDPADPEGDNPPTGDHIGIFVFLWLISGVLLASVRKYRRGG